jgi:hypothetical protein
MEDGARMVSAALLERGSSVRHQSRSVAQVPDQVRMFVDAFLVATLVI